MTLTFAIEDYREAVADQQRCWKLADGLLYRLCREHPDHTDVAGINAKLMFIGRGYTTGIERKIPSTGGQASSLSQLCDHLYANARAVDGLLQRLAGMEEPLDRDRLSLILETHGRFTSLVGRITRDHQAARTFASKYLHFHCAAVPVFDSIVLTRIPGLVRWRDSLVVVPLCDAHDETYHTYVMRFWKLYQIAQEAAHRADDRITVKRLDYYLLWMADRATKSRTGNARRDSV